MQTHPISLKRPDAAACVQYDFTNTRVAFSEAEARRTFVCDTDKAGSAARCTKGEFACNESASNGMLAPLKSVLNPAVGDTSGSGGRFLDSGMLTSLQAQNKSAQHAVIFLAVRRSSVARVV